MTTRDPLLPPAAEDLAHVAEEWDEATEAGDCPTPEDELQSQLDAALHDLRLERASFQSYRTRVDKEKAEIRKYGGQDLALDLLRVIDYFEMSLTFDIPEISPAAQSVIEGVKYTVAEMNKVLEQHGITAIDTSGAVDPNLMEVISTEPRDDVEPGTIVSVANKGYYYKDKVLRVARVTVSAAPE